MFKKLTAEKFYENKKKINENDKLWASSKHYSSIDFDHKFWRVYL